MFIVPIINTVGLDTQLKAMYTVQTQPTSAHMYKLVCTVVTVSATN